MVDDLFGTPILRGAEIPSAIASRTGFHPDTVEIVGVVSSVRNFWPGRGRSASVLQAVWADPWRRYRGVCRSANLGQSGGSGNDAQTDGCESRSALVPVSDIESLSELMMQSVGTTRFSSLLASLFAVVALVLGMVGIYSVLAYIVAQRQREIAVRLALGASRRHVMGDVLRQTARLTGLGIAPAGLVATRVLTHTLAGLFVNVSAHDPAIFIRAATVFASVALASPQCPRSARPASIPWWRSHSPDEGARGSAMPVQRCRKWKRGGQQHHQAMSALWRGAPHDLEQRPG